MEASCRYYDELMDEALDACLEQALPPPQELSRHLAVCDDCDRNWRRLQRLHGLLLAEPPVPVPANFRNRVMARIDAWTRSRPAWQLAALQLGAILAGVGTVVAVLGLLGTGQGAPVPAPVWLAAAAQLLRAMVTVGGALAESPWVALSYPFIAAMLAAMWFLALFGPRLVFKPGRGRTS
jgi:anti-sigma factor RsiW